MTDLVHHSQFTLLYTECLGNNEFMCQIIYPGIGSTGLSNDCAAEYFLAYNWSSGTPQIHNPVKLDCHRLQTT